MSRSKEQQRICLRFGAEFVPSAATSKVGIALATLSLAPLNALRHEPEDGTSGWYIWGGELLSGDSEFF